MAADAITGGFDTIAIAMVVSKGLSFPFYQSFSALKPTFDIQGAMYFLVKNPEKMKILRDEIRGTFETDDEITLARVNSLPYLTAVFSETLRLWPPGPETLRRVTNGPGGNIIDGEWVPPNVSIQVLLLVREQNVFCFFPGTSSSSWFPPLFVSCPSTNCSYFLGTVNHS